MTPQEKLAQQIEVLETLARCDAEIKRFEAQISEEQTTLDTLKKELAKLEEKLSFDREAYETMTAAIKDLTVEIRQMAGQVDKSRDKLGRSRTERETQAAEREIDELKKLTQDRQDEANKLQALIDAAKKSIDEVEIQREKISTELNSNESAISTRIRDVSAGRERALAERNQLIPKLPRDVLRRYDMIRQKRGSGVARVVDGNCTACHMSLSPMLSQRLYRRDAFESCPHCQRLVYWTPPVDTKGSED